MSNADIGAVALCVGVIVGAGLPPLLRWATALLQDWRQEAIARNTNERGPIKVWYYYGAIEWRAPLGGLIVDGKRQYIMSTSTIAPWLNAEEIERWDSRVRSILEGA